MRKLLLILFACFFACAGCAEEPDGTIVMNEETIENFFEKDKKSWDPGMNLNLLTDQPVVEAEIPGVEPGMIRVQGTLKSHGAYVFKGQSPIMNRGGTFSKSVYGMLGPAGDGGNAWFYADFNPANGQIVNARAYMYGVMTGVCDLREAVNQNYGQMTQKQINLNIGGYCLFPQTSGAAMQFAIFIKGNRGNVFTEPFDIEYILEDSSNIFTIPENPQSVNAIFDYGTGRAGITPGGNAR